MRFLTAALVAAAATAVWLSRRRSYGSNTNASDAVDDIELGSNPTNEERVDASVMGTFPASDPPATEAGETAYARRERLGGSAAKPAPAREARRSPDWLTRPPR
jgi:hypothetical protein